MHSSVTFAQNILVLSNEKFKAGIFDGPQIRKVIKDDNFVSHMTETEAAAWSSSVAVAKGVLGNNKAINYHKLVEVMLKTFMLWEQEWVSKYTTLAI